MTGECRQAWARVAGALLIAASVGAGAAAQQAPSAEELVSRPLEIPPGESRSGFEIARLNSENYGAFEPHFVTESDLEPLSKALADGRVATDTRLLVTETAGGPIALLTDQLAYHHLAQGRERGTDWMATF